MENINWLDDKNHLILNNKLSDEQVSQWTEAYEFAIKNKKTTASIFLLTSGTSGSQKLVCLSKNAILANAKAVNTHLGVNTGDRWLNTLPSHHIGGLSIYARAFLSESKVDVLEFWDPTIYYQSLKTSFICFSSLVPTQVYDLLELEEMSPKNMRTIIVGGSRLAPNLYEKAKKFEYPIVNAFGATELASQIATSSIDDPRLKILSHVEAKTTADDILLLKSPALFSYYVKTNGNQYQIDLPKIDGGFFVTEDHVEIKDGYLIPKGRSSEYVKILGEAVSLVKVEKDLEKNTSFNFCIIATPHERNGYSLGLACESKDKKTATAAVANWNNTCIGYERIATIYTTEKLPRNDLGKISKKILNHDIEKNKLSSLQVLEAD